MGSSITDLRDTFERAKMELEIHVNTSDLRTKELQKEVYIRQQMYQQACNGLSSDRIANALTVLEIVGLEQFDSQHKDDEQAIDDAILWFFNEGKFNRSYSLTSHRLGVKNYDGFYHQRCDCEYGFGPRHGTVVFSIGLRSEYRTLPKGVDSLPCALRDDCMYYLESLKQGYLTGDSCQDEGCPHYGTKHSHPTSKG